MHLLRPISSVALAIAPLLLSPVLAACGDDGSASATASASGGETTTTSGGETTSEGSGSESEGGGAVQKGCDDAVFLEIPEDPAARGPWAVGARTFTIADRVTEIWYPAKPGSEAGLDPARYDIRLYLPADEQGKIPDEANPFQICECYRDLPLDEAHGPYPGVIFIHGTAGFRTQSLGFMTHWASRGFIVVASDHDGITLSHILGGGVIDADQPGDARKVAAAVQAAAGDLAWLSGHVDAGRFAASGHSAGGFAVEALGDHPGMRVLMPMAGKGTVAGPELQSTLVLGAIDDQIVPFASQTSGYDGSPARKRLVGLSAAGHLAFSDLCVLGAEQGGILQIGLDYGVDIPDYLIALASDGCGPDNLAPEVGFTIVEAASSAVLAETLQCSSSASATIAGLPAAYPDIGEFEEGL
ncbi:MAG: hypothetical protein R3B09_34075 [Nannocystaceae bacterium]